MQESKEVNNVVGELHNTSSATAETVETTCSDDIIKKPSIKKNTSETENLWIGLDVQFFSATTGVQITGLPTQ